MMNDVELPTLIPFTNYITPEEVLQKGSEIVNNFMSFLRTDLTNGEEVGRTLSKLSSLIEPFSLKEAIKIKEISLLCEELAYMYSGPTPLLLLDLTHSWAVLASMKHKANLQKLCSCALSFANYQLLIENFSDKDVYWPLINYVASNLRRFFNSSPSKSITAYEIKEIKNLAKKYDVISPHQSLYNKLNMISLSDIEEYFQNES